MDLSNYRPSPSELITSAFCEGSGETEALNLGLMALVNTTAFERASIYLMSPKSGVELSYQYSESSQSADFTPKASGLMKSMNIVLSCPGPGNVEIIDANSAAPERWRDYFDLSGTEFTHHARIFLIAPEGYNFGLLTLEGHENAFLTEEETKMFVFAAQAMTLVIDYMRLTRAYTSKTDECAAIANELLALKDN